MSADTAPGARDVEDDPSAEEALASLEEADALAASDPGIGPSLPPAVSRKRARPPASAAADTRPPIRRHPDGERMHPRKFSPPRIPTRGARGDAPAAFPYLVETKDGRRTIDPRRGTPPWSSTALLDTFYGVKHWDVPRGHLCPPAANRANYVHWIEDLLELSRPASASASAAGPAVVGLDVGVGASCVYPLIGASLNGWRFVGIDVTDVAVASARANAAGNPAIRHLIEIRDARTFRDSGTSEAEAANDTTQTQTQTQTRTNDSRAAAGSLLLPAILEHETFAFCVCNPPFFDSDRAAGARRRKNPGSDFGGSDAETSFPGGERAFTARLFQDSLALRGRVHWFTTMCGKKETAKHLRRALASRDARVAAVRTTVFRQGKTARWGVAWSFAEHAGTTNDAPLRRGSGSRNHASSRAPDDIPP